MVTNEYAWETGTLDGKKNIKFHERQTDGITGFDSNRMRDTVEISDLIALQFSVNQQLSMRTSFGTSTEQAKASKRD